MTLCEQQNDGAEKKDRFVKWRVSRATACSAGGEKKEKPAKRVIERNAAD